MAKGQPADKVAQRLREAAETGLPPSTTGAHVVVDMTRMLGPTIATSVIAKARCAGPW